MKAVLKFDLPEERVEFRHATDGGKYAAGLVELDEWLRRRVKYDDGEQAPATAAEAYQRCRDQLRQLCTEDGIDPWAD